MAASNIYVLAFFTALVAVNLIFAEDNSLEQESEFFDQVEVSGEAEREARSANEGEGQERTFGLLLGLGLGLRTTCNSTAQVGLTCSSCTQALRCFANNIGYIRNCRGFRPYCNNGQCTFLPSSDCSSG